VKAKAASANAAAVTNISFRMHIPPVSRPQPDYSQSIPKGQSLPPLPGW
jgi:hypothetical protein